MDNRRTVSVPRGKSVGQKNVKPTLHPKISEGLIKLALMVSITDDEEVQRAAKYIHKLGVYLTTPEYLRAKSKRLATKVRCDQKKKEKQNDER